MLIDHVQWWIPSSASWLPSLKMSLCHRERKSRSLDLIWGVVWDVWHCTRFVFYDLSLKQCSVFQHLSTVLKTELIWDVSTLSPVLSPSTSAETSSLLLSPPTAAQRSPRIEGSPVFLSESCHQPSQSCPRVIFDLTERFRRVYRVVRRFKRSLMDKDWQSLRRSI